MEHDYTDEEREAYESEEMDRQYDMWRDMQGEALYINMQDVTNFFLSNTGYYKNRPDKFVKDCISMLLSINNCEIKCIGNDLFNVYKNESEPEIKKTAPYIVSYGYLCPYCDDIHKTEETNKFDSKQTCKKCNKVFYLGR